jgi:MFS family permease
MLTHKDALGLTTQQSASAGTFYLVGAIAGAFVFGYLTDRFGRKNLFTITLAIYLVFTVASGLAWDYWSFVIFRLLAGAGIGGEYSAINSAIDELIPARVRGRVALAINGSWWVGTAGAAFFSYVLLHGIRESVGWRLGFFVGATLALGIIIIRRFIPESPRWLLTHGRPAEAEQVVAQIEGAVRKQHPVLPEPEGTPIVIEQHKRLSFPAIAKYVIQNYPQRGLLGLALMTGQAFLYNAIFFTYTLVLTDFFDVSAKTAPLYLIPFAIGNFLGPLLLGPLFDTLGRRVMIPFTYITSGLLLIATGQLFVHDVLTETTMTIAWCVIFFFASAGASSAYLSVSELFPLEARAMVISLFYAFGTGLAAFAPNERELRLSDRSRTHARRRNRRGLPRGPGRAALTRGSRFALYGCSGSRSHLDRRTCSREIGSDARVRRPHAAGCSSCRTRACEDRVRKSGARRADLSGRAGRSRPNAVGSRGRSQAIRPQGE